MPTTRQLGVWGDFSVLCRMQSLGFGLHRKHYHFLSMPSIIGPFIAYLTAWGGVVVLVNRISSELEKVVRDSSKRDLVRYVTRSQLATYADSLVPVVDESFERFFGKSHVSLRCFVASVLSCYSAVLLSTLIWLTVSPDALLVLAGDLRSVPRLLVGLMIVTTIAAVLPAYLATFKTRYLVRTLRRTRSIVPVAVLDLSLSTLISGAILYTLVAPVSHGQQLDLVSVLTLSDSAVVAFNEDGANAQVRSIQFEQRHAAFRLDIPLGVWFYAGFLPSFWIWLLILVLLLIRISTAADYLKSFLSRHLDTDSRPIVSVGWIANAFITLVFASAFMLNILV